MDSSKGMIKLEFFVAVQKIRVRVKSAAGITMAKRKNYIMTIFSLTKTAPVASMLVGINMRKAWFLAYISRKRIVEVKELCYNDVTNITIMDSFE